MLPSPSPLGPSTVNFVRNSKNIPGFKQLPPAPIVKGAVVHPLSLLSRPSKPQSSETNSGKLKLWKVGL